MKYTRKAKRSRLCVWEPCGTMARNVYRGGSYEFVACGIEHAGLGRLELEKIPVEARKRIWGEKAR